MAVHTEELGQQLLPEAVHYRQDDEEGGDAEGDAEHREGGDDGDEALLPARAEIAQGDEALESGNEHSDGLASQLGEGGLGGKLLAVALPAAALQLHGAALEAARTDHELPGQADQIPVGELGDGQLGRSNV